MSGSPSGLVLAPDPAQGHGASVIGDPAGVDTVVRSPVAAPAAAAVCHRVIQLWVDVLRAAGHMGSSVHQGEGDTAALDQEAPPKPSPQIGVLREWKQGCLHVCVCVSDCITVW